MNSADLDTLLERICAAGCSEVRRTIARLEAGEPVAGLDGVGAAERAAVLDELKAVMAVYDATDAP